MAGPNEANPPRQLPGFYWDPEKQKYFGIDKTKNPIPSQAKYTEESINKRQKREKAENHARKLSEQRAKFTIRKPYTRDRLMTVSLDREIGARRTSYYMHGLWPDACIPQLTTEPQQVAKPPAWSRLSLFDRDPNTNTLYAAKSREIWKIPIKNCHGERVRHKISHTQSRSSGDYSPSNYKCVGILTSLLSSLNYLPSSGTLAATSFGDDRPPVVYLTNPDKDEPFVSHQFTPRNCHTIWGAAARPANFSSPWFGPTGVAPTDTEYLAVAASSSLLLLTRSPDGDWKSTVAMEPDSGSETGYCPDILALDWLSPTTIALGDRAGRIHIYDIRSKGSSHILTHYSTPTGIKRADDPTRIVCTGLQNSLVLYDIRTRGTSSKRNQHFYNDEFFNGLYSGPHNHKKRKLARRQVSDKWSQPILKFQHESEDDLHLGLAVHSELGLIAAAQKDDSPVAIKIHNMWTGRLVKDIMWDQHEPKVGTKYLKFMTGQDGEPELWSTWGSSIVKWTFD